jgi:hypothetical protein
MNILSLFNGYENKYESPESPQTRRQQACGENCCREGVCREA